MHDIFLRKEIIVTYDINHLTERKNNSIIRHSRRPNLWMLVGFPLKNSTSCPLAVLIFLDMIAARSFEIYYLRQITTPFILLFTIYPLVFLFYILAINIAAFVDLTHFGYTLLVTY